MKDYEIVRIGDDEPDANCSTLPDGSCVAPGPCMHTPEPTYPQPTLPGAPADDVEYDIIMPNGGGVETVAAGQLQGKPDPMLLAKQRLFQLKMVNRLLKMQKRKLKRDESKPNRVKKSRKHRDEAKKSRKKNRK